MNLPGIDSLDVLGKRVIVRGDLDVHIKDDVPKESGRLELLIPTLYSLYSRGATKIIIIGHRGRPKEREDSLSTEPLMHYFAEKLERDAGFAPDIVSASKLDSSLVILENLRFFEGETENSEAFTQEISSIGDVYVNDAFGSSHREHASIVGIPSKLPHMAGLQLQHEVEHLSKVLENPERPLLFIISGAKEDKLTFVEHFAERADKVLIGGRLPEYVGERDLGPKVVVSRLLPDKEDITMHAIEHFEGEIRRAKTIVVSGPVGRFEEVGHRQGTERVFRAIAESDSYSVAGGGDTEHALIELGLKDKIDWVSTGGGAMLEFLSQGTLPGINALIH